MTKRIIKIIKRDAEEQRPPAPTTEEILVQQQKDDADEKRDMTKAVKNWISERRENSKAEEIHSNSQLFDWDSDNSPESPQ
ncbi:MAG: hypothetical protein ACREO5_08850 [Candidatus Binatia bacterium]